MKFFLKTAVFVLFVVSSFKAEAQSVFGESWYSGGFSPKVYSLSLSPKGDVLAVLSFGDPNFTVEISFYDVQTGKYLKKITEQPDKNYEQIVWSPKGDFLITRGLAAGEAFTFIDTATCEHFQTIPGPGGAIQYSPDSTYILAGKFIYSTADFGLIDTLAFTDELFAILPGDSLMVSGGTANKELQLSQFPSGDTLSSFLSPVKVGLSGYTAKRTNPNELVMVGRDSIIIMNIVSREVILKIPWSGSQGSGRNDKYFLSRDEHYLFAGFSVFDLKNQNDILTLNSGRIGSFQNLSVLSDNSKIFYTKEYWIGTDVCRTGSLLSITQYVKAIDISGNLLWRAPSGNERTVYDISFDSLSMGFSSTSVDSFRIIWNKEGTIVHQSLISQLPIIDTTGISPSGRYIINEPDRILDVNGYGHPTSGSLKLHVRSNSTNEILLTINDSFDHENAAKYYFQAWAWMPNDRYILTASRPFGGGSGYWNERKFLKIWDIETGKAIDSMPVPCYPTLIKVSPDGKSIALATEEFGIIHIKTIGDFATSVLKEDAAELSLTFYPNPLKESSTISCSLPADGLLKITLHDMLGREVAVVHDAFKSAGNYTFPFKRENLADGLYFLKMTTGGQSLTKSVSVVR